MLQNSHSCVFELNISVVLEFRKFLSHFFPHYLMKMNFLSVLISCQYMNILIFSRMLNCKISRDLLSNSRLNKSEDKKTEACKAMGKYFGSNLI